MTRGRLVFGRQVPAARTGEENKAAQTASGRHGEKPLARETRFGLIYALSRAQTCAPHPFEAPFVQLLMRPGHFIFTLWRATPRRCTDAALGRLHITVVVLPAVLPDPGRFVPAYANPIAPMRREKETETPCEERFFQYTSVGTRTIAGKIITVFTAERIHVAGRIRTGSSLQGRSASLEYLCELALLTSLRKFVNSFYDSNKTD